MWHQMKIESITERRHFSCSTMQPRKTYSTRFRAWSNVANACRRMEIHDKSQTISIAQLQRFANLVCYEISLLPQQVCIGLQVSGCGWKSTLSLIGSDHFALLLLADHSVALTNVFRAESKNWVKAEDARSFLSAYHWCNYRQKSENRQQSRRR